MTENTTGKPAAPMQHVHHQRRLNWGWWIFAAAALFYLLSEHQAHFFGVLPWLILLACPLMHLFMHHGHGGHGQQAKDSNAKDEK